MSDTMETAPLAVPRDRSVEAGRAKRQAKASRERRIMASLNRGVSVAVIAEWEDVGEKHMRALVRDILARRMPEPPAQFIAMQVSRLNEALRVSYDAMAGANLQAVDRVVKIVRELDRYHGLAAAERWSLPDASEAPEEVDEQILAQLVDRIRHATPQSLEKTESAPGNVMARKSRAANIRATAPSRLLSTWPARRWPAGKWRRKGLKRLNSRREMVWPRKPRTPRIWYNGAT